MAFTVRTGVDDVLDEQHVAADQRSLDHVGETEAPMGGARTVACCTHELELCRNAQAAEEVRGENSRAL